MSRTRQALFIAVCAASCLWAMMVFFAASIRFEHQGVINLIRNAEHAPNPKKIAAAIADYSGAVNTIPCNEQLLSELLLLRAYDADQAMAEADDARSEESMAAMQDTLATQLACSPRDGKAWFDLAMMHTLREGFGKSALATYKMSAMVAPKESWLAQKRLTAALAFVPMFDAQAKAIARADLAVLERAHPNRILAVQKEAGVDSADALKAIFAP